MIGTVRWWNCDQGYGFVQVEGHTDVFVHHLALRENIDLQAGQKLVFDVVPGQVNSVAANVRIVRE